ncbi:PepSY-like domain-containing protein [Winogradskyella arenosi]|uniref:Putative PepSY-like beta-lactamase-inhibitor n=1 Tax=Winogradskyella arenosi TaxID=533325 RepID=A0A368ZH99_9FLAO|nr:PepSY-like domain-containing protein [Winogradskyella arenosi]RCW92823.1 putative PepSY-like beta-lactamase-inhibitor [Winogradskyella arenosi]
MKKQISIFATTLTLVTALNAQDIPQSQVPSVIVNAFHKQFPKATDLEWEMDGNLYNVDFEMHWNEDHDVWYNAEGIMVRHKEDLAKSDLPEAVRQRIKTDFTGYTIDDLERITDRGNVIYKMELNAFTTTDWDVVIDSEGSIISKIAD